MRCRHNSRVSQDWKTAQEERGGAEVLKLEAVTRMELASVSALGLALYTQRAVQFL